MVVHVDLTAGLVEVVADHRVEELPQHNNTIRCNNNILSGSVVRALDSGLRGREFESRRLRCQVTTSTQPSIPLG